MLPSNVGNESYTQCFKIHVSLNSKGNTGQNNIEQCSYNSLLYDAQMSLRCQKVQIMHSLMQCPLKPYADEKKNLIQSYY